MVVRIYNVSLQLLDLTHCITSSGYFQIKVPHETQSVVSDTRHGQVTVLIICLLYIFTATEIIFLNVCWLFWVKRPFETVFQSISGRLPEKRREKIDEGKKSKQAPPVPAASAVGPCPTIIQISRTPRHFEM